MNLRVILGGYRPDMERAVAIFEVPDDWQFVRYLAMADRSGQPVLRIPLTLDDGAPDVDLVEMMKAAENGIAP